MNKFISIEKAVAQVKEGMTVMVGGFLANGTPNAIVDALAQSGVKNLTFICNDTAYPAVSYTHLMFFHPLRQAKSYR